MPITFVPQRGQILISDFDKGRVSPEMPKTRRVVIVSPRSYNQRHGAGPGRCLVVPLSASPPKDLTPADVEIPVGSYATITETVWAICSALASHSHARLDRVSIHGRFVSQSFTDADMARIELGLMHALGMAPPQPESEAQPVTAETPEQAPETQPIPIDPDEQGLS